MSEKIVKFYGRRKGRPLLKERQHLMNELMPTVRLSLSDDEINPKQLLQKEEVWFEVGFGGGEHLAYQAGNNPSIGFLGAEAFLNGVASLLRYIHEKELQNIRIYEGDVRLLLPKLQKNSFSRIFILFPDPWPKTRHYKRRLINEETLKSLHGLLEDKGVLRIASDEPSYSEWILNHIKRSSLFEMPQGSKEEWQKIPSDWIQTRYEKKARREGRTPLFMDFKKCTLGK